MSLGERAKLWGLTTALMMLASVDAIRTGRRLSHMSGVVGRGTIRVVDNPTFPEHDFFRAGQTFPCRLRHSSATYPDEAMLQVRGLAIKFADSDYETPLDLEMNTGETSVFWTLAMFWRWTTMRLKIIRSAGPADWTPVIKYFEEFPAALKAAREGVRRNPSSFSRLFFYTGFPIHFRARDSRERYAKFRLIPGDRGPESGLPPESDLKEVWKNEARVPGDTRPLDYLSQEWAERVKREGAHYLLQIQIYERQPSDTTEIFNSSKPWISPWHDLATIDISEVIPAEKTRELRYSIGHQPPSLGLIAATSVKDYNSMNYARARMALAKHVRIMVSRLRGPAPVPARPTSAGPEVPTASS